MTVVKVTAGRDLWDVSRADPAEAATICPAGGLTMLVKLWLLISGRLSLSVPTVLACVPRVYRGGMERLG